MNNSINSTNDYDIIDGVAIIKKVWTRRKLIFKPTICFFVIGCVVALLSPVSYTSQTTFVPQVSDESASGQNGLGSLASLAGINLNSNQGSSIDNYLSPLLYSNIIESEEFSLNLIKNETIYVDGEKLFLKDYLLSTKKSDYNPIILVGKVINFIKKYSIDLLINDDRKNKNLENNFSEDYNFISNENYELIFILKEKFSIVTDKKQGYIKVISTDKDAFVSAQLVKLVTKSLQDRIISLRTSKIKEQLDYSREQYLDKKKEFEILQNNLAKFRDSNKNISTALFYSELQKLESEYNLQQNILLTLANEFNSNKIKLNKDTPIFSVLDEVSIPNKRSNPQRTQVVLLYTLIGLIGSVLYILSVDRINYIINKITDQ